MGERGPARTPTMKLKLRGNKETKWRRNEPQPREGEPQMPVWFGPDERARWQQVLTDLRAMRLLSVTDEAAIIRYCRAWARYLHAERDEDKEAAKTCIEILDRFEKCFGLTPSARAGMAVVMTDKKAKQEGFFLSG